RGRVRGVGGDPDGGKGDADKRFGAGSGSAVDPFQFLTPPREVTGGSLPFLIPIYYDWEFQTAAAGSDVESLVRRMTAAPLPPSVGTRPVDAVAPDPALPPVTVEALRIDGALRSPAPLPPWDPAERAP